MEPVPGDAALPVRWRAGAPAVRAAVEGWLAGAPPARWLRDNPRRRVVRLEGAAAGPLIAKHFRTLSGRHRLRERIKAAFGAGAGAREWRALRALRGCDVPVPEPLAFGRLANGDDLLVLRTAEGALLSELLPSLAAAPRRALAGRLGEAVRQLHAAGYTHGDLHSGNVLETPAGALLLDLQHARRTTSSRARHADLGALDSALRAQLSRTDRVRLHAAALGLTRPFDPAARAALRAVGAAAAHHAHDHARGRTRRALRPGRRVAHAHAGEAHGLRLRGTPETLPEAALTAHRAALAEAGARVLKSDDRTRITAVEAAGERVVVKEMLPRRFTRILADTVRGSAGRRAWRAGHGLAAREIGVALPLAYLEERRFGLPLRSLVVLPDQRPARDAVELAPEAPEAVAEALTKLLVQLHRRGVDHGDLKVQHVFLVPGAQGLEPRLIDLEQVRFRRKLPARRRLAALAEVNASLPDSLPDALRRRAFARYTAAHPFPQGSHAALREVVEKSLARRHRWSGAQCALARKHPR